MRLVIGITGIALATVSLSLMVVGGVAHLAQWISLDVITMVAGGATLAAVGSLGGLLAAANLAPAAQTQALVNEQAVLGLAKARSGRVTVAEVAAECGLAVTESKAILSNLSEQGVAELLFQDDGTVVYAIYGLDSEAKRLARDPFDESPPAVAAASSTPVVEPVNSAAPDALQAQRAPYGVDPQTGLPFSDRVREAAAVLQILPSFVGFGGLGRLYMGHIKVGVMQLLLGWVFGVGLVWSMVDGFLVLFSGKHRDAHQRPLRPRLLKLSNAVPVVRGRESTKEPRERS